MTVVTPKDTPAAGERRGAVFLDRDQTLNVDHGYTYLIEDFAWIKGAPEALAAITAANLHRYSRLPYDQVPTHIQALPPQRHA